MSFPKGASVNNDISSEHSTVSYCRVDDAIALIKIIKSRLFLLQKGHQKCVSHYYNSSGGLSSFRNDLARKILL